MIKGLIPLGLLQGHVVYCVVVIGIVKPKTVVPLKGSLVIHPSGFLPFLAFAFAVTQDNKISLASRC